jgi:hypothetical protein
MIITEGILRVFLFVCFDCFQKPPNFNMNARKSKIGAKRRGFTLVITVTLMILLTLLAVGMLTLSSVSLRGAGSGDAMNQARQQARLGLMMALGELQKGAGPDRAITAPASVINETRPQGVTGIWTPWETGDRLSRTKAAKASRFNRWLVSTVDGSVPNQPENPPLVAAGTTGAAKLLDVGSLGEEQDGLSQRISLQPTRVSNGRSVGAMAWAVVDESAKARLDLSKNSTLGAVSPVITAGAPPTDGISALDGLEKFDSQDPETNRLISMKSTDLAKGPADDAFEEYHSDLTVHSAGLLTDVVEGGFKKDLSLMFSRGLPSTMTSAKLYQSTPGLTTGASDPSWSYLLNFHDLYRKIGKREGTLTPQANGITQRVPTRFTPTRLDRVFNAEVAFPATTTEPVLMPTIVRVDTIFSLIARNTHGGWINHFGASGRSYMLHMQYLPIVTLHNPYSVPLTFDGLKVTFKNLPVGFQFLVDDQPVTTRLVPLNQLYVNSQGSDAATKDFSVTLQSSFSSGANTRIELAPGQTQLFGTPSVPPTWRWQDESPGAGADGIKLFDWRNDKTANFQMIPRLVADATTGTGFDVDWLAPAGAGDLKTPKGNEVSINSGCIGLKGTERIGVRYGPYAPPSGNGNFIVDVEVLRSGTLVKAGSLAVRYGTESRLKQIVEQGTSLRFPDARSFPETFPKPRVDPTITVADIFEANGTPISAYTRARPFMIFSMSGKTTQESFTPSRVIADSSPVQSLGKFDLSAVNQPVGGIPVELVMMPIRNGNAAVEDDRATGEGFFFGGHGSLRGSRQATVYEIPHAPLQSIAQFRHANLAGFGFMPRVTYTVGESRAHPQIGTSGIVGAWRDGTQMIDHTWSANEALWDSYFLSTAANQEGPLFGASGKTADVLLANFFSGSGLLLNQRLTPYNPGSTSVPSSVATAGRDGYLNLGAHMLVNGAFNVNSTSEDAWVAILSALRNEAIQTHETVDAGADGMSSFPRVRRPAKGSMDSQLVVVRENRWQGYRRLTDDQIRSLATEITREIRTRGPFLSMGDFVNRGLGPEGDPVNLKGALQAAIDRTSINAASAVEGVELGAGNLGASGYVSTIAGTGNSAEGSPGFLSQGDILSMIGSHISVRSDTFTIRAYGEARDTAGTKVLARAWCEAVVQRVPDYVDPTNEATVAPANATDVNKVFGRRFHVVSFRWLAPEEV